MTKQEYLNHVKELLNDCDEQFVKEMMSDFEEHFEQGKAAGKTEAEIAESLGDIGDWVEEVKQEYARKQELVVAEKNDTNEISRVLVKGAALDVEISGTNGDLLWQLSDGWIKKKAYNGAVKETVENGCLILEVTSQSVSFFGLQWSDLTLELNVPFGMKEVHVETLSGDIEAETVQAEEFILSSHSGDIKVRNAEGNLKCRTLSGDVEVSGCKGNLTLSSTSGDIEAEADCVEMLRAKSTSGDVDIKCEEAVMVEAVSTSGDMDVEGQIQNIKLNSTSGDVRARIESPSAVLAESKSGDIELILRGCSGMQGTTDTRSGDVDVDFEQVKYRMGTGFAWGDGSTQVAVKTTSGDIRITE